MIRRSVLIVTLLALACTRPAQDRALSDLEIGIGSVGDTGVTTPDAHIVATASGALELWANHPVVDVELEAAAETTVELGVDNCMPGAEVLVVAGELTSSGDLEDRPTRCQFTIEVPAGPSALRIAPPDYDQVDRFRIAIMGDIQTGLAEVGDVFDTIDSDPAIRFVVSTGDLVQDNRIDEYEALLQAFAEMDVPYFSTIGNHELAQANERWSEYFGRHTVHFDFKGVSFSFVDAGNATIDPVVYDWLDDWLDQAGDRVHLYGQHYPAIDPVGVRQSAMRSRKEAAKLLGKLSEGEVDATFYGHLHSYYAYENAGIPAYISGGGGAYPERWDGIGRHFLAVDLEPSAGRIISVGVVRVDP